MAHEIGNVYKGEFEYQDQPGTKDFRRMILLDIIGENQETGLMTQITSQPPKIPPKFYDQYREPIEDWLIAGLTKKSYARVNKNFVIPLNALRQPIGKLDDEEFYRIVSAAFAYIRNNGLEH